MRKRTWVISAFVMAFVLNGCATPPTIMKPETASGIKKVGVFISLADERPVVLDHTHVMEKTYGGYQFGLVGALLEFGLLTVEQKAKSHSSLGGGIDELRKEAPVYPVKALLEREISERLSKKYELADGESLSKDLAALKASGNDKLPEQLAVARKHGLDALIVLRCAYGLAAYAGQTSCVAIDAQVMIHDVRTGETLIQKSLSSDEYMREPKTVQQCSANGAALFKQDITAAATGLAIMLATEFGLEKNLASPHATIQMLSVTCKKPYPLTRDCSSFSGAQREIEVDGFYIKVAGSDCGKYVLMMGQCHSVDQEQMARVDSRIADTLLMHNPDKCLLAIREKMARHEIHIVKTTTIKEGRSEIAGYLLELDGDGYALLTQ